ncbi:MAG: dipeptide ABC transporter ATP-binding protein [Lautropia sp.]
MSTLSISGLDVEARLGEHRVLALRDVSLEVGPGEIVGLIGESGAGKSMIGRMLSRLLPASFAITRGELRFQGRDLRAMSAEEHRALLGREICFIPQEPRAALDPVMSIGRQFDEHLRHIGVRDRNRRRAVTLEALVAVKLYEPERMLARHAHQLSGGQCQRVLIAMAFMSQPALIVADEPTTALDVDTQAVIMRLLANLCRSHRTAAILITHDLNLAAHVCDRTTVLYAGEIAERGSSRMLHEAPLHPYTRALRQVNPPLDGPRRVLPALPDHMPSLGELASLHGCRFAPRCPQASDACRVAAIDLRMLQPLHDVRCITADRIGIGGPAPQPLLADAAGDRGGSILEVRGLHKHYRRAAGLFGQGEPVVAVNGFDLSLQAGEFVGIVGQSGSGKSTVAKLLLGLEKPTAGDVLVDGRSVLADDPATRAARIGSLQMIFQDPQSALNPRRTVANLVTYAMVNGERRASAARRLARARELLATTGLSPEMVHRYPSQLSGGQRQRVNIARALCNTPRILVADEILSGLDVSVQAQILRVLLQLRQASRISLLLISHDLAAVRYLCSRVLVMYQGEVVESGPVDDVLARPRHEYTRRLVQAIPPEDLDAPWLGSEPRHRVPAVAE